MMDELVKMQIRYLEKKSEPEEGVQVANEEAQDG